MSTSIDNYDYSIIDEVWISLPNFITWLQKGRNKKRVNYATNLTILLHSTCIIEGFLFDTLFYHCGTPSQTKSVSDRLLLDFQKRLENASWSQYIDLFLNSTGQKLSSLTDNETWKAITILFQLRNQLTHGKFMEISLNRKQYTEPIVDRKYSSIYSYYKEVGLINPKAKDFIPGQMSLVTTKSADFFYAKTKLFLEHLVKKFVSKHDLEIVEESYEIAFEE